VSAWSACRSRLLSRPLAAVVSFALAAAPAAGAASGADVARDDGVKNGAAAASAGRVPWTVRRFVYKADSKRLSEVLADFSASQNLAAIVADGVDGVVQANFDTTPSEFLSAISRAYGLIWYFDGSALYFYPSRAMRSRLFRLKGYTGAQVEQLLRSLKLLDARYPLRYDRAENTLLVYGPPRHVELVSAAIETLDAGAAERDRSSVRVFALNYGWAADRLVGGRVLPGVASTLNGLYSGSGSGAGGSKAGGNAGAGAVNAALSKASTLQKTYGLDKLKPQIPVAGGGDPAPPDESMTGSPTRGLRSPVGDDDEARPPMFQADEATNAVIVRGRRDRMDEYADLIRRLDVAPLLVELEATIIDVSSDMVDALGVNWSVSQGNSTVSLSLPGGAAAAADTFTASTLWSNAGRQVLARISALESTGKARVIAKPRVLGVANRTAVMQESRIANVRVAGNLDTSLYQIEAGTTLQVTPQVVRRGETWCFKLSIYIRDGDFEDTKVDQIPVVKRTEIVTEAELNEGESLLVGGIALENESTKTEGVPGLSKMPVVGGLFRWKQAQRSRSERLFLITPRMIRNGELPPKPAAPGASAASPN